MTDAEPDTRECPYCEWSISTDDLLFDDPHVLDHRADLHYERGHCGEVRVTVTVDRTLPLHPGQSTEQLRSHMLDLVEGELRGFEVAYASTETPDELSEVLEEIQQDVEAERERRDQRQDELERLREENERLREQKEELEQELEDVDRIGSALEKLNRANNGGSSAAQDVGEGVADLQERVDELKAERDRLQDELDRQSEAASDLAAERDRAQEQIADLEAEVQELRSAFDAAADDVASLAETFDVDVELSIAAADAESTTDPVATDGSAASTASVQDAILEEFQAEAIDRIEADVESLSDLQRRLLKYIESRGKTLSSQKAWAQQTLGLSGDPNGSHYEAMGELIDGGFVRKNKDNSIAPNVRELVENELGAYDVDEAAIEETYEEVLARLAGVADA